MLWIFSLCGLTSAMSNRSMDPLVTALARDFDVSVAAAAGVVSIYALPYAFGQPILGPIGDYYGKARVLRFCLWVQAFSLMGVVLSPTLGSLMSVRFVGGIAGGGIMPIAMAMVGDRYPPAERQQAIARYVSASLFGFIMASAASGMLAVYISWRAIFFCAMLIALVAAILVTIFIEQAPLPKERMHLSDALAGYGMIFANPRALICFGAVLLEGTALYGTTPYIAPILESRGQGGPWQAGMIIMGLGIGGFMMTMTMRWWLKLMTRYQLMFAGGFFTAAGPLAFAFVHDWRWAILCFCLSGIGYMMVHNSIQAEVAALAPKARGSAFAMHSCSFFVGQSLGPILFGFGKTPFGDAGMLCLYAAVLLAIGPVISILFRRIAGPEPV